MKKEPVKPAAISSTNISKPLDATYWNTRYQSGETGWDLGTVSPPLKAYIDQLENKSLRILIPGGGNSYEAAYLLQKGFTNVTVIDFAPTVTDILKKKFAGNTAIKICEGNFFDHAGQYDLILEQTFFCALNPALRKNYATKMADLLTQGGKLAGLLFDKTFESEGPPFGGSKNNYIPFFEQLFDFVFFDQCYNSHPARTNTELFIVLRKK